MSGKRISTFCRARPTDDTTITYHVRRSTATGRKYPEMIEFCTDVQQHDVRSEKLEGFHFTKIFDSDAQQKEVFEEVGRPVTETVLAGINGTIFAYGQTATGKTYTILGEKFDDVMTEERGLIPRSLSFIFERLNSEGNAYEVLISYLEIYDEKCYDLLSGARHVVKNELDNQLKQVFCRMDASRVRLTNLSIHTVRSEDEAMSILLRGSKNRSIAETYANETSSRSHCIFTVEIRKEDETGTTHSKLNFVDLAGSERGSKSSHNDKTLKKETNTINVSLLHLHKVIMSITEGRAHVPFRNTMLTKILRDSLIGNCKTCLVATVSADKRNCAETISTCRFAQSVSKIKTKPVVNKKEDLSLIIDRLQEENRRLMEKVDVLVHTPTEDDVLSDEEKLALKELVIEFFNDDSQDAMLKVSGTSLKAQYCFDVLKILGKLGETNPTGQGVPNHRLSDEEMKFLDRYVEAFLSTNDTEAHMECAKNPCHAQYCLRRLRNIVKQFSDEAMPEKKKSFCKTC